jgi:site-specific DNA recombinase
MPADDLEAILVEQLKSFLVSPTQVAACLGRAHDTLAEKERLLESRKKEAEKICQDTDRTHRLYLDGEISAEAFGKFFRPIEERQSQLEEELPKLQAEIDFLGVNSFSSDQVMNDATYLQASWPGWSEQRNPRLSSA